MLVIRRLQIHLFRVLGSVPTSSNYPKAINNAHTPHFFSLHPKASFHLPPIYCSLQSNLWLAKQHLSPASLLSTPPMARHISQPSFSFLPRRYPSIPVHAQLHVGVDVLHQRRRESRGSQWGKSLLLGRRPDASASFIKWRNMSLMLVPRDLSFTSSAGGNAG